MNRSKKSKGKFVPKEPVVQVKRSTLERQVTAQMRKASEDAKKKATEAAIQEINRQILERDESFSLDVDSMVLWALYRYAGWGKKRLTAFYKFMVEEHTRMREYYQLEDTYPERYHLKDMGVDVEALNKEMIEGWHKDQNTSK